MTAVIDEGRIKLNEGGFVNYKFQEDKTGSVGGVVLLILVRLNGDGFPISPEVGLSFNVMGRICDRAPAIGEFNAKFWQDLCAAELREFLETRDERKDIANMMLQKISGFFEGEKGIERRQAPGVVRADL